MSYISGTMKGYAAQYRLGDKAVWKPIEYKIANPPQGAVVEGIPFPLIGGGILREAWLMGHAQARALAWTFAANWEATHYGPVEVRVVAHDVKYTIEHEEVPEKGGGDAVD
jgi:hypothetical protein